LDKGITLAQRDEENLVPCKHTCPAEVDIPRYVHLIAEGRFADAVAVIREKVPFPETLGNICPHDCELKCRRGEINEPVSIRALKRVAAEHDDKRWKEKIKIAPSTGKKVAIIGSGPAGLTVAYYLTELGHSVTIFESQSKPGGMMRTGIPRFQLPEKVLDGEIDEILSLGVELKLNSPVQSVNDLLKDGYDAVFVGIGLQKGRKLPIPGVDLEQVLIGLDFLEDVSKGKEVKLGENVLVLGGGAVACDVARIARRLGAPQVSMSCLESRETLPARPWEIKEAEEEGIKIFPSRSFKRILENDGRVSGVECVDVKWMEFDADGKLNLETVEGSEHILEADTVIFAIGQALDRTLIENDGLELTKRGTIKVSPENLETTHEGVFAGGDAASGPASVIEAIATGRKAASSIDEYLGGDGEIEESLIEKEELSPYLGKEEGFAGKERIEAPLVSIEERVKSLDKKVELCLTEEQAIEEAKRCLRCDLRFQLGKVVLPPEAWIEFTEENIEELVPETEGVYRLVDEEKNIVYIGGAINLREDMDDQMLDADEPPLDEVRYFDFEEEPMYTVRQSELLQQYLQQHGSMPPGN
jgi:NADPH-dependent glutamate synthase beta subunit-like oxidoreductase